MRCEKKKPEVINLHNLGMKEVNVNDQVIDQVITRPEHHLEHLVKNGGNIFWVFSINCGQCTHFTEQDWLSPVYSGRLEIYSTHPGALMHYLGLEFHFKVKSRVHSAIQILVCQSRVQTMVTERLREIETQDLPKFIP